MRDVKFLMLGGSYKFVGKGGKRDPIGERGDSTTNA